MLEGVNFKVMGWCGNYYYYFNNNIVTKTMLELIELAMECDYKTNTTDLLSSVSQVGC